MKLEPFKYDKLSKHVIDERSDRFAFMLTKIGYHGIVRSVVDEMNPAHTQHITDTGLFFITGEDENGKVVVVTGYLLTINKAKAIYKDERLPQVLYNNIIKNMREYADQFDEDNQPKKKSQKRKKKNKWSPPFFD